MPNSFVTTPIYYVNDAPHIGHAYTSVMSDILARLKRLEGNDVKFLTGTDEHGQKVEKSAQKNNKTPIEFCDEISLKFRNLAKLLNISHDDFIRTSELRHKETTQTFWQRLEENNWIYKGVYEGWYAIRDEAFYNQDELIEGKAPTGAEVTWQKEESYFFALSAFQDILLRIYDEFPNFICPNSKKNEIISFVRGGKDYKINNLKDLSISRTSFKWGVHVPGDDKHIIYVWLDALVNYITALSYPSGDDFNNFWLNNKDVTHIVGKDILRFHCVYWPAFLIASKYKRAEVSEVDVTEFRDILPNKIYAHGWWTNKGEKISKSLGNVIEPVGEIEWLKSLEIEEDLAIDYFRYFLAREVSFGSDGNYLRDNFINRINSELANNIGNLCQRTLSMIYKNNNGSLVNEGNFDIQGKDLLLKSSKVAGKLSQLINNCDFDQILQEIINLSSLANEYLHQKAPWSLKKEGKIDEMNNILYISAEIIRKIAILLIAFIPKSSDKMLDLLNISPEKRNFANLENTLEFATKINEPKVIFTKIDEKNAK